MRDFFIRSMEQIINVFVGFGAIGVVIAALVTMFGAHGGALRGLAVLVIGGVYLVLVAGAVYLGLGIHDNTRRTAEATEAMARR